MKGYDWITLSYVYTYELSMVCDFRSKVDSSHFTSHTIDLIILYT